MCERPEPFFLPTWRGDHCLAATAAVPLPDAVLKVTFENGVVKHYDFKKRLAKDDGQWVVWKEDGKNLKRGMFSREDGDYPSLDEDGRKGGGKWRRVSVIEELVRDEELFRCATLVGSSIVAWNDDIDIWTEHVWAGGETVEYPQEYLQAVEDRLGKAESEMDALAELLTDISDAPPCVTHSDWECPILTKGECLGCAKEQKCGDEFLSMSAKQMKHLSYVRDHKLVCNIRRRLGEPSAYSEWKRQRKYPWDSVGVMECWRAYAATKRGWEPHKPVWRKNRS